MILYFSSKKVSIIMYYSFRGGMKTITVVLENSEKRDSSNTIFVEIRSELFASTYLTIKYHYYTFRNWAKLCIHYSVFTVPNMAHSALNYEK